MRAFGKARGRLLVRLHALLYATAFCWTLSANVSAQDDYLKALEAEAQRSAAPPNGTTTAPEVSAATANNGTKTAAPTIGTSTSTSTDKAQRSPQEKFEQLLQFELPSTYKFYLKLSAEQKAQVLSTYEEDKKLPAASKKIFDFYFKKK